MLLAIGTVLLVRNMNKRIKRLPERFPSQEPPDSDSSPAPGS
ncbi:hypothetical protein GCM10009557_62100 [Virgisporangium ochraceum]|uniref:Uncharacterized protein n=1 Tax=Virgisporangium ochraceum TaxID=65505 RepID=A0A8J4E8C1_9ACTN|nr:hypothetical protein Voc01_001160 [Virgisporangium ochraceum]